MEPVDSGHPDPMPRLHQHHLDRRGDGSRIDAEGGDLRGEDIVTGPGVDRNAGLPFDIRFHIHPKVTCSIVQNGESVLLRTPRGGGWRFHARGGEISLDESVYLGRHGESRRCEQIVVACKIGAGDNKVNWSLKRIDSGA